MQPFVYVQGVHSSATKVVGVDGSPVDTLSLVSMCTRGISIQHSCTGVAVPVRVEGKCSNRARSAPYLCEVDSEAVLSSSSALVSLRQTTP